MPVRVNVDHAGRFVTVVMEGRVLLSELFEQLDNLLLQAVMPYAKLFDARGADLQFNDDDVMALAARAQAYAAFSPRGPVALVAGSGNKIVLWRFMNLARGEREIALFERIADAREWLARSMNGAA